jgi:hypothetical protein
MRYNDIDLLNTEGERRKIQQMKATKHNKDFTDLAQMLSSFDIGLSDIDKKMISKSNVIHRDEMKAQLIVLLKRVFSNVGLSYEVEKAVLLNKNKT